MAEPPRRQSKKPAVKPGRAPTVARKSPIRATAELSRETDIAARIRALEAERDRLAAELKAARERIAALEAAREQVLNRIDWVIDSLHSLAGE